MIKISSDLLTGVQNVDDQHRAIINRVNKLLTVCEYCVDMGHALNEAKSILEFLSWYTAIHFRDEERLQMECLYPEFAAHKREHELFVQNFVNLQTDFLKKGVIDDKLLQSINTTVVEWLVVHIGGSDVRFAKYYLKFKSFLPKAPKIL